MTLILLCISLLPIALLLLYPLVSMHRAAFFPHPVKKNPGFKPPVSILIACYNEERYIEERIESLLHEDEWLPGSELIIVSTGSTDRTNEILERYASMSQVTVHLAERITKIEAVNYMAGIASHDYFVFSDCRQVMLKGSVAQLVANLEDPSVGTVTCTMMDTSGRSSFFRRLYAFLARCDSRSESTFNLYGALYAQRRSTFRPIPDNLLFDDLFVAVSTLAQKKRLIQEKQAVLFDVPFPDYYNRERIERLARGLLIFLTSNFLLIRQIPFRLRMRFFVYKYLKLVIPFFLLGAVVCGGVLFSKHLSGPVFLIVLSAFIASVCLVPLIRRFAVLMLRINSFFLLAVYAFVVLKRRSKYWEPLKVRRAWFLPRNG